MVLVICNIISLAASQKSKNVFTFLSCFNKTFFLLANFCVAQGAGCLNRHIDEVTLLSAHITKGIQFNSATPRTRFLIPGLNQENRVPHVRL